jgi:AraC-like DNA-binding protein
MLYFEDFLKNNPAFKKFEVNELLFAAYDCPLEGSPIEYWVDKNYFCYILRGGAKWKTPYNEYILQKGDAAFLKKGAHRVFKILTGEFCALMIFAPDQFIKSVITDDIRTNISLPGAHPQDSVMPLVLSQSLHDYFRTILNFFSESTPPSKILLNLKFRELIINLVTGPYNPVLTNYFVELSRLTKKALPPIMEEHFIFNLKLKDFAKLSGRSLATFKRDFEKSFHTTPGKWLKKKRLGYSKFLLETTDLNISEIALESGFENISHFIKIFKEMYHHPPHKLRKMLQTQTLN